MWLRKNALKLAIGAALIAISIAMVADWWSSNTRALNALAKNVYWEAVVAREPELSARMVAHVTSVRAQTKRKVWGGADIHAVVYARKSKASGAIVCQFSWTCLDAAKREPAIPGFWNLSLRIAKEELKGKFVPPAHLVGATNYLNPDAPVRGIRKNICWFKTSLVELGKAENESQHVFYREPKNERERNALPKKKDVEECGPEKPKKKTTTTAR